MLNVSICAATGHRPGKLGGYSPAVAARLDRLAEEYLSIMRPDRVISGMALGWDQAWTRAAVRLGIPFDAAVPFEGQESAWPSTSQADYRALLTHATRVSVISPPGYAAWKMQKRDQWMVDKCTRLVALWDGTPGGTKNCIDYATGRVEIVNLFKRFNHV
jgi:uncharacterized phage-like protein YoqJ